jgi:hypothetical protein
MFSDGHLELLVAAGCAAACSARVRAVARSAGPRSGCTMAHRALVHRAVPHGTIASGAIVHRLATHRGTARITVAVSVGRVGSRLIPCRLSHGRCGLRHSRPCETEDDRSCANHALHGVSLSVVMLIVRARTGCAAPVIDQGMLGELVNTLIRYRTHFRAILSSRLAHCAFG